MGDTSERTIVPAVVFFKTVAQVYDPDDPSLEQDHELSDRAEDRIFLTTVVDLPPRRKPNPSLP